MVNVLLLPRSGYVDTRRNLVFAERNGHRNRVRATVARAATYSAERTMPDKPCDARTQVPTSSAPRRAVIAGASALALGLLLPDPAHVAQAANGDPLVVGSTANSATSETRLDVVGATVGTALRVSNTLGGGIEGRCWSGAANGVHGTSSRGAGVQGESDQGPGTQGVSSSGYGVEGVSSISAGWPVVPRGSWVYGSSGSGYGELGTSRDAPALSGSSTNSVGVFGHSDASYGVLGTSSAIAGLAGDARSAYGVYGNSVSNAGVYGQSQSGPDVSGNSLADPLFAPLSRC